MVCLVDADFLLIFYNGDCVNEHFVCVTLNMMVFFAEVEQRTEEDLSASCVA